MARSARWWLGFQLIRAVRRGGTPPDKSFPLTWRSGAFFKALPHECRLTNGKSLGMVRHLLKGHITRTLESESRSGPRALRTGKQHGGSMLEYALLIALISMMGFASVKAVGTSLRATFLKVNDKLGECVGQFQCGAPPDGQAPPE